MDKRPNIDKDTLARLEWAYLPLLEHSSRPAKVLLEALSAHPSLFIDVLSAVFKPSEESGVDPEPREPDRRRAIAQQAYRLLELWDRLPGSRDDGTIDSQALESWITEARSLAKEVGREEIADDRIGAMLSASPIGADGVWPAEAVRDAIDLSRSKPMIEGFRIGKMNRRGVTTRMPRDGGDLEWKEAAKVLDTLADSYEREARRHDEDAERLDWEP